MTRRSIAIVIHDGVQALDVAGPADVFAEANGFLPGDQGYDIRMIGAEARPMRSSNGLSLKPDLAFDQADSSFHTALVAGGPALPTQPADPAMSAWLRGCGTRAERYGSICTGAFALGRAGLLDDRRVTTHWQTAHLLAAMFPKARVAKVQAHVMSHAGEAFPVERLARIAGISPRSIDRARNLLEGSDQPLKSIAFDCGFGGPEHMRAAFQRRLGVSPAHYRSTCKAD